MKKITLLLLLFSFSCLFAQKQIKGTVKDNNGAPLIGVNVLEKGTQNGTQGWSLPKWQMPTAAETSCKVRYWKTTTQYDVIRIIKQHTWIPYITFVSYIHNSKTDTLLKTSKNWTNTVNPNMGSGSKVSTVK